MKTILGSLLLLAAVAVTSGCSAKYGPGSHRWGCGVFSKCGHGCADGGCAQPGCAGGACANGACANGACASGACADGACAQGACAHGHGGGHFIGGVPAAVRDFCMAAIIAVTAAWLAAMACWGTTSNTPTLELKPRRTDHRPAPLLIRTTLPGGRAISSPPIPRASDRN